MALLVASAVAAAAATPPIGEAKKVVPSVSSEGESGKVTLSVGGSLFQDDLVRTGNLGRAGLQFLDQTELEVGPNSSTKLDRFVFNPDKTASDVSINLAKGVFRFISGGQSRPNTYTLTTPHATLGIRGTKCELRVAGTTQVFCWEGYVEVCGRNGGGCLSVGEGYPQNYAVFNSSGLIQSALLRNAGPGGFESLGSVVGSSTNPSPRFLETGAFHHGE